MEIKYTKKTDDISWDIIHEVLWEAHASNRDKGIVMSFPALSGEKLCEKIELGNGNIYVALDDNKVVGTVAYTIVNSKYWFCKQQYIYECLESILPQYSSRGIYKKLCEFRLSEALKRHDNYICVMETHIKNSRVIKIKQNVGYKIVAYKVCSDGHYNVIMAKWPNECPYSNIYIQAMRTKTFICAFMKKIYQSIKR